MEEKRPEKVSQLEAGLAMAMQALDNQINREVQRRTPGEREVEGVDKWEPISERVERVTALVLQLLGEDSVRMESLLVLAQAHVKALRLALDELGEEGTGKVRYKYCLDALKNVAADAERSLNEARGEGGLA